MTYCHCQLTVLPSTEHNTYFSTTATSRSPTTSNQLFMAAIWNRAGHYVFILWLHLSSFLIFFPRLISAVGDWMSAILPHMAWP